MTTLSARSLSQLLGDWRALEAGPAYLGLPARIRLLVLDGRVPLGTRLPAERELAATLTLSRTTVTAAYAMLRDAGFLTSTQGSGSVARLPHSAPRPPEEVRADILDFSKASLPAPRGVRGAALRAAQLLPAYLGHSGFDTVGLPVLREAIAERYRVRGLPTDADEILVTIGAQQAIALVSRVLLSRGDNVLVESPSYPHAIEALRDAGGRLRQVSVSTEAGWDEGALEQVLRRSSPTLGYLMPDFHNPTGQSMSDELREKIVTIATSV